MKDHGSPPGVAGRFCLFVAILVMSGLILVSGFLWIRAGWVARAIHKTTSHLDLLGQCLSLFHEFHPRSGSGQDQIMPKSAEQEALDRGPIAAASAEPLDRLWPMKEVGLEYTDAWGNPIYYRCPGPIHTHGWDLISCGPNGIYEEGQGDDIVVGEDLPPEEFARIMSGSTASVTSESK